MSEFVLHFLAHNYIISVSIAKYFESKYYFLILSLKIINFCRADDLTNTLSGENVGETNNNGLGYTVEVLEHIYTDPEFPKDLAPTLSVSLKGSGKSRADLWALATIAAVEYGVETNNFVCDGTPYPTLFPQCNQEIGTNQCHVSY